jgi:hypothetical protein
MISSGSFEEVGTRYANGRIREESWLTKSGEIAELRTGIGTLVLP